MKLIIIEGGDRLGKNTLIKGIINHFNMDNVTIRHFGKPPKIFPEGMDPISFQAECFYKEGYLLENIYQLENDEYGYYENVVIWNRSHIGEYVYGQMFRGVEKNRVVNMLNNFEERFLMSDKFDVYLILLTADPAFFLTQEDGNSFSKNLTQKTIELNLFNDAFNLSSISKKQIIKVNEGNTYVEKQQILNNIIKLINNG